MERLVLFRIFACFPLFGLLIPDALTAIKFSLETIAVSHAIIEISLAVSVIICYIGTLHTQYKQFKALNPPIKPRV